MAEGYDFDACFEVGRNFESILIKYFREKGRTVEDKTRDMQYQKAGIDFVLDKVSIDAKCDLKLHDTGNVAFELISNLGRGTVGSTLLSKADKWCYGEVWTENSVTHLRCHSWSHALLIRQIEERDQPRWGAFKTTTGGRGSVLYATIGLLVPLAWIRSLGKAIDYECFDLTPRPAPPPVAAPATAQLGLFESETSVIPQWRFKS